MTTSKRRRRWLIAGAVGLLALGLAVVAATRREAPQPGAAPAAGRPKEPEPITVTVAPVTARSIQRTVQVVGSLYGHEEMTITPEVEGRVTKILHDVGDLVKPGDLLLEIEPTDHRLAVLEAARAVEMELAKIDLRELPSGDGDLEQVPTVAKARAVEDNARLKLERVEKLPPGAIAREEFEERKADYRVAQTTREEVVMMARATLAAARHQQALLAIAEEKLKDTRVLAPEISEARLAAGGSSPTGTRPAVEFVVAERLVSEGEMVRAFPSVPVFRLVIEQPLKLKAIAPERNVGLIKVGQPLVLTAEAYPGEEFPGTVSRVNPTVDRQNRTFQLEALVPNGSRKLKPGSFVKASIATHLDPGALAVPEEALVTFAGITKVFVVEDGRARAVEVESGARLESEPGKEGGNRIEVVGKLKPGDLAVTSGQSKLAEGTPVRVRPPADQPPAERDPAASRQPAADLDPASSRPR